MKTHTCARRTIDASKRILLFPLMNAPQAMHGKTLTRPILNMNSMTPAMVGNRTEVSPSQNRCVQGRKVVKHGVSCGEEKKDQILPSQVKKVHLPISVVIFLAAMTLYVVLLLHAVLKTIMVAHYCDCGWNFQFSLDQLSGCVECQA